MAQPVWHVYTVEEVLEALEATPEGLSESGALQRRLEHGANRLPPSPPTPALRILANQFANVVVYLLLAGAGLAMAMGDGLEAIAIASVLAINIGLGFALDLRARRAMEALARMDQRWCLAWRDGALERLEVEMLVPGDVIELETGRTVPADARVLVVNDLHVSEAALTGESVPILKCVERLLAADTPLADRLNMVYKGSSIVAGTGRAVVVATGPQTEIGRIGTLLAGIVEERTPLERRLDVLGRHLVWITVVVAALVASLGRLQGLPLSRIVETAIALAVAAVPEGLPAVVTITLAIGLRRMAARHALIRRLSAVEALGSVTVVCTDKTRTLTSGDMTVVRLWTGGVDVSLESHVGQLDSRVFPALEVAVLASSRQPTGRDMAPGGDPVELALVQAATDAGIVVRELVASRPLEGIVPFSSRRRFMASIHRVDGRLVAYLKGAPVRVLSLSENELTYEGTRPLDLEGKQRLLALNREMAAEGLHVIALATGEVADATEPSIRRLTFVGFAGLLDPPAEGVRETVARLSGAGLSTIMLTGDQRGTALAIGRRLGLGTDPAAVLDGREAEALSADALAAALDHVRIFSRVTPETKLTVVRALQQRGDIVAMLGDGVNDAAALKKADVGVTMGRRGSDVAREAAAIVLEDDRFETIGAAVEEGRVIYDNIQKFVFYLFSCNLAEVLVLLVLGLLGLPPLVPLQILWLNLVTDTAPALALALEPGDPNVLRRPPRKPSEALLSRTFLTRTTAYALLLTASTIGAVLAIDDPTTGRVTTVAFVTLALAEVLHLGNARSINPVLEPRRALANRFAVGAVLLTLALQAAAMFWPPAVRVLQIETLTTGDWIVVGVASALTAIVGQILKVVRVRHDWHAGPVLVSRA